MDANREGGVEQAHLSGEEELAPGAKVIDFWAWALGDLRLNSTRGLLAQFLVARAVGDARRIDDGWGPYDVLSDTGIKIEVKSSGYVQSWAQKKSSSIQFSGLITKRWNESDGTYTENPEVVADVYVFAVHTCEDRDKYDTLNLSYWDFYVLPGATIRELNQKGISLSRLRRLGVEPVKWNGLRNAILQAYEST